MTGSKMLEVYSLQRELAETVALARLYGMGSVDCAALERMLLRWGRLTVGPDRVDSDRR